MRFTSGLTKTRKRTLPSALGLGGDDEQILTGKQIGADSDLARNLLLRCVRVLSRLNGAEVLPATLDAHDRADLGRVGSVALGDERGT